MERRGTALHAGATCPWINLHRTPRKRKHGATNLILTPPHGLKHSLSLIHACGWQGQQSSTKRHRSCPCTSCSTFREGPLSLALGPQAPRPALQVKPPSQRAEPTHPISTLTSFNSSATSLGPLPYICTTVFCMRSFCFCWGGGSFCSWPNMACVNICTETVGANLLVTVLDRRLPDIEVWRELAGMVLI